MTLVVLVLLLAAGPGSESDPLATTGYVQRFAQFQYVAIADKQVLKLGPGAELVLIGPAGQLVPVSGLDALRDRLVNLSAGESASGGALAPFQHYLNASTHEVALRFGAGAEAWVRGVWR